MTRTPRYQNSTLIKWVKKLTVPWSVLTTLLYMAAIPLTIWVFPATTLLLAIFVLFGGFTASMAALGSALVASEQDKATASVEDAVSDEKVVPSDTQE
jgi:uncharacterized membrane protein YdjX (TVP38/TMEM64 family)